MCEDRCRLSAPQTLTLQLKLWQLNQCAGCRDYADADENWTDAVAFLDAADGAGWGLLSAMMNPKWELRPTAGSCLMHPFLKGVGVQ